MLVVWDYRVLPPERYRQVHAEDDTVRDAIARHMTHPDDVDKVRVAAAGVRVDDLETHLCALGYHMSLVTTLSLSISRRD